jgi:hypothetical protein
VIYPVFWFFLLSTVCCVLWFAHYSIIAVFHYSVSEL